jgi:hypothetical protein
MSNPPRHLDSLYRRRYEEYVFDDGVILNSRVINWRDVENWHKLKELRAHLIGKDYIITKEDKPNFVGFVRYRNGGQIAQWDEHGNKAPPKKIDEWCIGWTDGVNVYVDVINFKTGEKMGNEVYPLHILKNHIHPNLKNGRQ